MSKRRQRRQLAGRGGRRWWPVIAVTALALAAVGGLIWFGQGQQPERPRAAIPSTGNVLGRPDAPVEIELWADFQCPACRAFALGPGRQLEETLIAQGRAKLAWRNFAFLGPESLWAAEAAACAGEQGQFWAYHDTL